MVIPFHITEVEQSCWGHSFQVSVKKGLHVLHDFKIKRLLIQSCTLFEHFQTLAESSLINKQWYYNRRFVSYFKYSPPKQVILLTYKNKTKHAPYYYNLVLFRHFVLLKPK